MKNKLLLTSLVVACLVLAGAVLARQSQAAYGVGLTQAGPPVCNNEFPGTPQIATLKVVGPGSVELTWEMVDRATSWTVAYGSKSGVWIYGVHNFGDSLSRAIKINRLPGGRFYFVLRANNGCVPGAFSIEKSITASSYQSTLGASTEPMTYTTTVMGEEVENVVEETTPEEFVQPSQPTKAPLFPSAPTPTPKPSWWQVILDFLGL